MRFTSTAHGGWGEGDDFDKEITEWRINMTKYIILIISFFLNKTRLKISDPFPRQDEFVRNYPNPFNSGTIIEFTVKTPGAIQLSIFNMLGQIIHTQITVFKPRNSSIQMAGWKCTIGTLLLQHQNCFMGTLR